MRYTGGQYLNKKEHAMTRLFLSLMLMLSTVSNAMAAKIGFFCYTREAAEAVAKERLNGPEAAATEAAKYLASSTCFYTPVRVEASIISQGPTLTRGSIRIVVAEVAVDQAAHHFYAVLSAPKPKETEA